MNHHELTSWSPHTLQSCLDSDILGYLTGVLAFMMLVWYLVIAYQWWRAANNSTDKARTAWRWLVAIFIICACAGYMSLDLALFYPKAAAVVRITALAAQNIACPIFMYYAVKIQFYGFGKEQALGHRIMEIDFHTMSEKDFLKTMASVLRASGVRLNSSVNKLNS